MPAPPLLQPKTCAAGTFVAPARKKTPTPRITRRYLSQLANTANPISYAPPIYTGASLYPGPYVYNGNLYAFVDHWNAANTVESPQFWKSTDNGVSWHDLPLETTQIWANSGWGCTAFNPNWSATKITFYIKGNLIDFDLSTETWGATYATNRGFDFTEQGSGYLIRLNDGRIRLFYEPNASHFPSHPEDFCWATANTGGSGVWDNSENMIMGVSGTTSPDDPEAFCSDSSNNVYLVYSYVDSTSSTTEFYKYITLSSGDVLTQAGMTMPDTHYKCKPASMINYSGNLYICQNATGTGVIVILYSPISASPSWSNITLPGAGGFTVKNSFQLISTPTVMWVAGNQMDYFPLGTAISSPQFYLDFSAVDLASIYFNPSGSGVPWSGQLISYGSFAPAIAGMGTLVNVSTQDSVGNPSNQVFYVLPEGGITLACPSSSATSGVSYSSSLTASGGTSPYSYAITSGSLPPGLTLNTSTGAITGTTTTAGIYNFTVVVDDSASGSSTTSCSITVSPPAGGGSIVPRPCTTSTSVVQATQISVPAEPEPRSFSSWTDIWPSNLNDPSTFYNDYGPFYHGGYVWFIYFVAGSTLALKASKSLNGENWIVAATSSPPFSLFPGFVSVCEYKSSSIHKAFIIIQRADLGNANGTASDSNGNQVLFSDLWSFDFNTAIFTQVTNGDNLCYSPIANSVTNVGVTIRIPDPPNGFANGGIFWHDLGVNVIIKADPNTGNIYLFCYGPPVAYTCSFNSSVTNYYLNIGYYIWNGTSWSSFNSAFGSLTSPTKLSTIVQAYIDSASNIYCIVATLPIQADSSSCNAYLANGANVTFSVFKNSTSLGSISTYSYNAPGCPPYNEPNLVQSALWSPGAPTFPGPSGAYPFPTTCAVDLCSKFSEVGGFVYFAAIDSNRNAILYKISGTTMTTIPIASNVSIWSAGNPPTYASYHSHIELMAISGQLFAMWITEDYLDPTKQKGNWFTHNWYHYPDIGCSSSATYSGSNFGFPSVNWVSYSGTTLGPITQLDCSNLVFFYSKGMMPYQVPSSGTYYNAGDITFAITYRGTNAALSTPYGSPGGSVGLPPPNISCPTTTSGQVGTPFSSSLSASGGTLPYTFSITSGALPAGLSLNSSTGLISGTPTVAGNYSFTAKVTGANSLTSSVTCAITITVPPPPNLLPGRPCS